MLRVLLFCFGISTYAAHSREPNDGDFNFRIIDGIYSDIEEFPYQASIVQKGVHLCGGSIISPIFILTAAHCTEFSIKEIQEDFEVRVGFSITNEGEDIYKIREVFSHPNRTADQKNDVSVIKLETELKWSKKIQPVRLPDEGTGLPPPGTMAVISGWGRTKEDNFDLSSHLMFTEVPLIANNDCYEMYSDTDTSLDLDSMFCAGYKDGGKDACTGDSGGALVVDGVQYGIVIWGIGCGRENRPGVYASVPFYRDYIREVTGI